MVEKQKISKEDMQKLQELQEGIFKNDFIKNIALSKYGSQVDRYGAFGKDALEINYMKTASVAPNQKAYEALFGEAVLGEGSITKEQIKNNAMKVWGGSLGFQKVNSLTKKMNYTGKIDSKYSGKNLSELGEEIQKVISSSYLQYELTELMKNGLGAEQEAISGGLEEMLAPKEKPKESK